MLRTVLAVATLGAAVAIFSCSASKLGGNGNDGGRDSASDACSGNVSPAICYPNCFGARIMEPEGGSCPANYTYVPPTCRPAAVAVGGWAPIGTCEQDGGTGGTGGAGGAPTGTAGAGGGSRCTGGTLIRAYCYRGCDGTFHAVPDSGSCPAEQSYNPGGCLPGSGDGFGPIPNSCGADGGCTSLPNDAAPAQIHFHSGERPSDAAGVGGTIVDGIYDWVGTEQYRSSESIAPITLVTTIRISNGGTQLEYVAGYPVAGGAASVSTALVWTLEPSGTQVTQTETCRAASLLAFPRTQDYTATPTTLMLSDPTQVVRYSRR